MNNQYDLNWRGNLTVDNIKDVVGLFRRLLDGEVYTFVSANEFFGFKPDVRTDQKVEHKKATNGNAFGVWFEDSDSPSCAGFNVVDTYGVWGLSTSASEQPYISFEWNKVTIKHRAGAGHNLWWVIAVQRERQC